MNWAIKNNSALCLNIKAVELEGKEEKLEGIVKTTATVKQGKSANVVKGVCFPFRAYWSGQIDQLRMEDAYFFGSYKLLASHKRGCADYDELLGSSLSDYENFPTDSTVSPNQDKNKVLYQIPINVFERKILSVPQREIIQSVFAKTQEMLPEEIRERLEEVKLDLSLTLGGIKFTRGLRDFPHEFRERALKLGHYYSTTDAKNIQKKEIIEVADPVFISTPIGGQPKN